jgi:hypothetical protein
MLGGGLNSTRSIIGRKAFIYNSDSNSVEYESDMIDKRYTFPMAFIYPYVYAIGGRFYGTSEVSIMRSCERFNLETHKWERMASMNHRRCSSHLIVCENNLFVFGGF